MQKYGFVYIWRDRKHNRYYIGSHWGTENDGYVCSSRWMRSSYRRRPEDFKRRIIERVYTDRLELFESEQRWLNMIKPEELSGPKYFNHTTSVKNHWSANPELKATFSKRQSVAQQKRWKENPMSPEHRAKATTALIASAKNKSPDHLEKIRLANLGKPKSEIHKQKMRERGTAHMHTPEARAKKSIALTGQKRGTQSDEHKAKLRAAKLGKKHGRKPTALIDTARNKSREHLEKIRLANVGKKRPYRSELNRQLNTGKKASEETKLKMKQAQKARWAAKKAAEVGVL